MTSTSGQDPRPHTGRRRNEGARRAILDATVTLLRDHQGTDFTIDAVAAAAGVGRQTIYRWWPSKQAVIADALAGTARAVASPPETGVLRDDLVRFLADTATGMANDATGRTLRDLMSEAQRDPHLAAVVADFTGERRRVLRALLARGQREGPLAADADLDVLVDLAYGFLWYRLLVGHAPLDGAAAERLADTLLAAGG